MLDGASTSIPSGRVHKAGYFADFVAAQCLELGLTLDDLRAWRPEAKRGRKGGRPKKTSAAAEGEGDEG